ILQGDNIESLIRGDALAGLAITSELHEEMELSIRALHQTAIVPPAAAPSGLRQLADRNLARPSVISRRIPNPHFAGCEPDMREVERFCPGLTIALVERRQEIIKDGAAFREQSLRI